MKLRKFNLSKIAIITAIIIALILIVVNFLSDDVDKKGEEMLDNIYKAAFEYKKTNNTYGYLTQGDNYNCFAANTFLRSQEVQKVFEDISVQDASCVLAPASTTDLDIKDWSVSLVITDKVYCVDSDNNKLQTPGITRTSKCSGE